MNYSTTDPKNSRSAGLFILYVALIGLLTACGGGQLDSGQHVLKEHFSYSDDQTAQSLFKEAEINANELDAAHREVTQRASVMPKAVTAAVARTAVYRFYNTQTGAHFYTISASERDRVRNMLPIFNYEGEAFYVSAQADAALKPVYRFFNSQNGVHFYSISADEKSYIEANLPHFIYEGIAYHASQVMGGNLLPLHRFYVASKGFHFYSSDESEVARIRTTLPDYRYEGISYYTLGIEWPAMALKLPHSGVKSTHCYQAGSDVLTTCSVAAVTGFNNAQDGLRTHINPMAYAMLAGYPVTSCVRDLVTGLVWEGKETSGARAGTRTFTYFGDGRAGDASAYVNEINAQNLCGFSDWRVPDMHELVGLVDYSVPSPGPSIQSTWFPNTYSNTPFWTTARRWGISTDRANVVFFYGRVHSDHVSQPNLLRLVRGPRGPLDRYRVTTVPYPNDFTGNAVFDKLSGLIWRRCFEGSTWTGTTCTGPLVYYTHHFALQRAQSRSGWRLPNVKELHSIVPATFDAVAGDAAAFPQVINSWDEDRVWQTTPCIGCAGGAAWMIDIESATYREEPRTRIGLVRLLARAP